MAGFLSKFARGVAGAGADLYADKARQDMLAEITAKRDARLEANRQAATKQSQEFTLNRDAASVGVEHARTIRDQEFKKQTAEDLADAQLKRDKEKPSSSTSTAMTKNQEVAMYERTLKQINVEQGTYPYPPKLSEDEKMVEAKKRVAAVIEMAIGGTPQATTEFSPKNTKQLPEINSRAEYNKLEVGVEFWHVKKQGYFTRDKDYWLLMTMTILVLLYLMTTLVVLYLMMTLVPL